MQLIDTEAKVARAKELFLEGYNCAQSVVAAYADEMGMSVDSALRLSSGIGGGLGGLRLTCGTVSAMALVLGAVQGYDDAADLTAKRVLYARIQAMHARFIDEYQTENCRELLKSAGIAAKAEPSPRTPEYYKARPCIRYVALSARILGEELNKQG